MAVPPKSGKILITGATGYVGFRVLLTAVGAGYHVVAAVRSASARDKILSIPVLQNLGTKLDLLSFVFITDFCVEDAFLEALDGVTYIIHVASPVPGDSIKDYEKDLIVPAVEGTRQILRTAHKTRSVKRIVFTSSVCAIVPWDTLGHGDSCSSTWNPHSRIPVALPPYLNQFQAYNASKTMALKEVEDFIEREKPSFDTVHIFPGWVIGRDDRAVDVEGTIAWTNAAAFGHVFGHKETAPRSPICGHINDVAEAHVRALDPTVPGNSSFGACLQILWDDAKTIIQKRFPEAVRRGIFPCTGAQPSSEMLWDNGDVEDVLGMKFVGFEEQVVSVAEHYLEELQKPGAKHTAISWDGSRK